MKHIELTYEQFCNMYKCIRALHNVGIEQSKAFEVTLEAMNYAALRRQEEKEAWAKNFEILEGNQDVQAPE